MFNDAGMAGGEIGHFTGIVRDVGGEIQEERPCFVGGDEGLGFLHHQIGKELTGQAHAAAVFPKVMAVGLVPKIEVRVIIDAAAQEAESTQDAPLPPPACGMEKKRAAPKGGWKPTGTDWDWNYLRRRKSNIAAPPKPARANVAGSGTEGADNTKLLKVRS